MEKKIRSLTVIAVILAIAVCICAVKINQLEHDVSSLENALNRQYQQLMNEVESIYHNVDQMLQEEASLLSGVKAEYGELNLKDHTIDVAVSIVPKLISDDMKVQLSINGRDVTLVRNSIGFSGTIPVDIYNVEEQLLMTIETDEGIQTQYLSEVRTEYLWENRIPSLYYCDISGRGAFADGVYILNGTIDINCSPVEETPGVKFEKFVLVTELNGEELKREDITEDVLHFEAYPHGTYWRDEYTFECAAQEGDELAIYVEATDSLGYMHRRLLHFWKEYRGAMAEAVDASEYIYDPNGNPVFP